jgi:hypothetical protein
LAWLPATGPPFDLQIDSPVSRSQGDLKFVPLESIEARVCRHFEASVVTERPSAGDPIPPHCAVIEVQVSELKRLFNAIDPSPFRDKDLDPQAEEFIVGWAKDVPANAELALLVHLDRPAGLPDEAAVLRDAVHEFFSQRALATRRRLRQLLRIGRTSLLIGLAFLGGSIGAGDFAANQLGGSVLGEIVRESFLIGGWVAMWRPLEIFLYDWWPIRNEVGLFERLATMPVRIGYTKTAPPEAWRHDWPAVPASYPASSESSA